MTKQISFTCDYCTIEVDFEPLDDPIEQGWLSVERFDIIKEEVVDSDFCCKECLLAFFND